MSFYIQTCSSGYKCVGGGYQMICDHESDSVSRLTESVITSPDNVGVGGSGSGSPCPIP